MTFFYSDDFRFPLPPDHRFPMSKYTGLRARMLAAGVATEAEMVVPEGANDAQIRRCHNPEYMEQVKLGLLTEREIRRIGFPWSPELVIRSRHSVGGTLGACREALRKGTAMNLAGGTHHACPDHGEGYCVFNDVAIAARTMQAEGHVQRVVIVDADVHQGNGTAACTEGDNSIFTFSIHGEKNYPFRKIPSDLDIGLPNGTHDDMYLHDLREGVEYALERSQPQLAIFIAGADPFEGDRLGKLNISKAGLAARDRLVFELCYGVGVPVAVVMGGGYAPNVDDIVDIHFRTAATVAEMERVWAARC